MAEWTFAVGPWNGLPTRELTAAKGKKLTFRRRNAGHSAGFSIDGRHEEALELEELVTDLHAWRDGRRLFRGRIGPSSDDLDDAKHDVSISVGDYRNVLERRFIFDGDAILASTYAADAGDLAWTLVALTQGRPSGDLGIVAGTPHPIGLTMASTKFTAGQSITKAIDLFANTDYATTGFDWEIDGDKKLVLYPRGVGDGVGLGRGRSGAVLDFGGLVRTAKRTIDPSIYANALRVSGDSSIAAVSRTAADLALRAEGRWESQVSHTDAKTVGGLGKLADQDLLDAQTIRPAWSVELRPDRWEGPAHLWLGDSVILRVRSGRLDVLDDLLVEELSIDVGDDGAEIVTVVLAADFPGFEKRLGAVERRLATLERH